MTFKQLNNTVSLRNKTRAFFQNDNWKKAFSFLFFLLLAFLFWIMQYLQQEFDVEYRVPIRYSNLPAEFIMSDPLAYVSVNVRDKGMVQVNYAVNDRFRFFAVDLKNVDAKHPTLTLSSDSIERLLRKRMMPTSVLLSVNPGKIKVDCVPLNKKEVPVVVDGSIRPAAGYMVVNDRGIQPTKVWIYGSKDSLEKIKVIYTEKLDRPDVDENVKLNLKLLTPEGVRLSEQTVVYSAQVEQFTEKTFKIPVACRNMPDDRIVRFFPSTVELVVQVALSNYASVSDSDFEVGVDYKDLAHSKQAVIPLEMFKSPFTIKEYRMSPGNVEYIVEKKLLQ